MKPLTNSKEPKEYPPSALYILRRELKIDIYHRRRIPGGQPMCPICGMGITIEGGGDLHEVFFTRGDVQGIKDEESHHAIFHKCNVVLVHHGQCHLTAQHTPEGKTKCVHQIVLYEGKPQVLRYLDQMHSIVKNKQAADYEHNFVMGYTAEFIDESASQPAMDNRTFFDRGSYKVAPK